MIVPVVAVSARPDQACLGCPTHTDSACSYADDLEQPSFEYVL
jgi:hypothetical protein